MLVVGQRGEQDALVLALRFLVAERERSRQRCVEELLAELAGNDGLPVLALQERYGFEVEAFFGNIGEQRKGRSACRS